MNVIDELITALRNKDSGRARSLQPEIGPSELGSCRRKVFYRLNSQPETNTNDLKLAAIMGTAIHTEIDAALRKADPKGIKFWLETEVAFNGMKAHVDCYIPEEKMIVDWKTVKSKTLGYFPSKQQIWQVQTYGYLMKHGAGNPVDTVALVAISRDGDERDVIMHSEPYNESIALEALAWLDEIKEATTVPEPEKDAVSYCRFYCKFYDESGEVGCTGIKKEEAPMVRLAEYSASDAAVKYLDTDQKIKELTKIKDDIKVLLEGHTGVTDDGIQVIWTPIAGRRTVDSDEVEKLLGFLPTKTGKESLRLEVKSVKQSGGTDLDGE